MSGRTGIDDPRMIWAQLVHLGYNMWSDRESPEWNIEYVSAERKLRFDTSLWDDLLRKFVDDGLTMVVIDLGEGVAYESHPELAVEGSWSTSRLKGELEKMRAMGLEPIPKLNFSTAHDAWLGELARCVSTPRYYAAVRDLIAEVIELFGHPPLFHLGMDEETYGNQTNYDYAIVRQFDLWWHDFTFMVDEVEKGGARAWIWSDYLWHHPDLFFRKMPGSVVQSNWYYGHAFRDDIDGVKAYLQLEEHGYDQIPTGSNWSEPQNFQKTVRYCRERIAPERLLGFLQTVWKPTIERRRWRHFEASTEVGVAKAEYMASRG